MMAPTPEQLKEMKALYASVWQTVSEGIAGVKVGYLCEGAHPGMLGIALTVALGTLFEAILGYTDIPREVADHIREKAKENALAYASPSGFPTGTNVPPAQG